MLTPAAIAAQHTAPSVGRLLLGAIQYLSGALVVAWLTYRVGRRVARLGDGRADEARPAVTPAFTLAVARQMAEHATAGGQGPSLLDRLGTTDTSRFGNATVVRRTLSLTGDDLAAMTPEQRQALLQELGSALGVGHLLEQAAADGTLRVVSERRQTSTGISSGAQPLDGPPPRPTRTPLGVRPVVPGGTQLTAEIPAGASSFPCPVCGAELTRGAAAMTAGVICPGCRAVSRVATEGDHFRVTTTRAGAARE